MGKQRFKNYLRRKFAVNYIVKNYNGTYLKCDDKKLYPNPQVIGMNVRYGFDITESGNIIGSLSPIVLEFVNHTETFSIPVSSFDFEKSLRCNFENKEKHPYFPYLNKFTTEFKGLKICNSDQ